MVPASVACSFVNILSGFDTGTHTHSFPLSSWITNPLLYCGPSSASHCALPIFIALYPWGIIGLLYVASSPFIVLFLLAISSTATFPTISSTPPTQLSISFARLFSSSSSSAIALFVFRAASCALVISPFGPNTKLILTPANISKITIVIIFRYDYF